MARVTNAWLDELSLEGDPEADEVIADHAAEHSQLTPGDIVSHVAAHLRLPEEQRSER